MCALFTGVQTGALPISAAAWRAGWWCALGSPCGCRDGVGSTNEWFVRAARLSHVAEQGHERLADRHRLGPLLEPDRAAAAVVACDRRDRLEVDDGRAVPLLEHRRVEQAVQIGRAPV